MTYVISEENPTIGAYKALHQTTGWMRKDFIRMINNIKQFLTVGIALLFMMIGH